MGFVLFAVKLEVSYVLVGLALSFHGRVEMFVYLLMLRST
jgi:hypothetical protein